MEDKLSTICRAKALANESLYPDEPRTPRPPGGPSDSAPFVKYRCATLCDDLNVALISKSRGKGANRQEESEIASAMKASLDIPRDRLLLCSTFLPSGSDSTFDDQFEIEAYKSATAEIRERLSHESTLYAFKFLIVAGILLTLLKLSKREEEFESFVQKRRAAVFFSATLLAVVVVDVSVRFNLKMVENLGHWIWCLERDHRSALWEHFLPDLLSPLSSWSMPLMRNVSLFLTALLYVVNLFIFVVLPSGAHRDSRRIIMLTSGLMFAVLAAIGLSYGSRGRPPIASAYVISLACVGWGFLYVALRIKRSTCDVVYVVLPFIQRRLEKEDRNRRGEEQEKVVDSLYWVRRVNAPNWFILDMLVELCKKKDALPGALTKASTPKRVADQVKAELMDLYNALQSALQQELAGLTLSISCETEVMCWRTSTWRQRLDGRRLMRKVRRVPEGRKRWKSIVRLLTVDADEAECIEEQLWNFYSNERSKLSEVVSASG